MMRHYDITGIRIAVEYKMYQQMEESDVDACAICLEATCGRVSYALSDKFGCECKQMVHEVCLAEWVTRTLSSGVSGTIGCIMCRKPVGIWDADTSVPALPVIIGSGTVLHEDMLRRAISRHRLNERMLVLKARIAVIVCILGTLFLLLLALAGILK